MRRGQILSFFLGQISNFDFKIFGAGIPDLEVARAAAPPSPLVSLPRGAPRALASPLLKLCH
jgi:hypothetical protein